tara:strand:- start:1955 stop:2248 length:294 start_codon:yes stop_codon:yes gene_type:complete
MNKNQEKELESAVFKRLVEHLKKETNLQNIELMNLAGFCRNCLSKWYSEEAQLRNIDIKNEEAREIIYGMPYQQWKEKYQQPATKEQLEIMKNRAKK